jgi:hypothetical protein
VSLRFGRRLMTWLDYALTVDKTEVPDRDEHLEGPAVLPALIECWEKMGGAVKHHEALVARDLIPRASTHFFEHLLISAVFELLCTVDQYQVTQSLGCELLARRLSLVEFVYEEAARTRSKPNWAVSEIFLGSPLCTSGSAVHPLERQKFLARRMQEVAMVAQQYGRSSPGTRGPPSNTNSNNNNNNSNTPNTPAPAAQGGTGGTARKGK